MRQECLNAHWLLSLEDVEANIAAWRTDYNDLRSDSALDWLAMNSCAAAGNCRQRRLTRSRRFLLPIAPEWRPLKGDDGSHEVAQTGDTLRVDSSPWTARGATPRAGALGCR
ncbi:MAG: integrase core domain-containing protein [Betaproteobacteria bacterium]